MPQTSSGLPYPSPSSANNPPYDFQKLAEATEKAIASTLTNANNYTNSVRPALANGFYVGSKWYTRSGIFEFTNLTGWTTAAGIYSYRRLNAAVPLDIPPGYAVRFDVVSSEHMCLIAGGDMWTNDAKGKAANAFILRMWNSTDAESILRVRWEVYKK